MAPDFSGQIWRCLVALVLVVVLQWLELQAAGRGAASCSVNKAVFLFPWRLPVLVLLRSSRRSPMRLFVKPSWWWRSVGVESGEVFFNKRAHLLLRFVWFSLMLSPLPSVHGGLEKGGFPATSNMMREDWGIPIESELIHDRGKLASTILCRQGGAISTSSEEALI
jgi:hypothetical protein